MDSCTLVAPAKINLYLEIIGDRPDGYHELVMVMQSIALADRIELKSIGIDTFRVHCSHAGVPTDNNNLAYRAAQLMAQEFPDAFENLGGAEITIDKQIPVAAGLAGGSTDAAAVLVGLDLMWNLGLTLPALQELGAKLGSDVPFCIGGGTALATGRGEKISPLSNLTGTFIVLGKFRSLQVSTPWAYQTFRREFGHNYADDDAGLETRQQRVHSGPMVSAILHQDFRQIGEKLYNDLERVVLPAHPQVAQLREAFRQAGGLGAMMSGSGPTVFAIAESEAQATQIRDAAREAIPDPDLDLWTTQFATTGIQVISNK
ncbi:MAG: 4-(cytidine 5'-diphospho)-2-C-methyl-D-erythritol kinase [Geitlerinemataceae cyanobacterium]